jgi:hypothetical protein
MGLLGDSSVSNNNSNQQSSQSSETNVDTTNTTINTNVTDNSMEMKSTDNSMEKSSIPMVGEMSITDEHKLLPAKTKWKTILSILNNMPLTAIILSTGKGKKMAITGVITAEEVTAAANKLDKHPKKLKIDDVILTNILEILSDVPITKALEMIQNKKPDHLLDSSVSMISRKQRELSLNKRRERNNFNRTPTHSPSSPNQPAPQLQKKKVKMLPNLLDYN